jgi:hypothetical protein
MNDIRRAVRVVLFANESEEYPYSTYGGTLFVVRYKGKFYALTCRHVFKEYTSEELIVWREAQPKKGSLSALITGMVSFEGDDELQDLTVIEFDDEVSSDYFGDDFFDLAAGDVELSEVGQSLRVHGYIKEKTNIGHDAQSITTLLVDLKMHDTGAPSQDHFIRRAQATWPSPPYKSVAGLSGAPITDEQTGLLCGMVVRGNMSNNTATIWFIDAFHIMKAIEAASRRDRRLSYEFYRRP